MPIQQVQTRARGGTANIAEILERVLDKGIVIAGDIKLSLGEVEILSLQIRLVVCSVDKAREMGMDWWTNNPAYSSAAQKERVGSLGRIEQRLKRLEESLAKRPEPAPEKRKRSDRPEGP